MSVGECAQALADFACSDAGLFCGAPVFVALLRTPGGEQLMHAGDLVLIGSEGFHRRLGPLAQRLGPLDGLAGVRQRGRLFPFTFRRRPVDVGLVPVAARLHPHHRVLPAVETLPAQRQQGTRPLDGLQRALLQGLHRLAQRPPALIELVLVLIDLSLALGQLGLTPVRRPLPLIRPALPLICQGLTLICQGLTLTSFALPLISFAFAPLSQPVALIRRAFALIRRALLLSMRLTLTRRRIPRPG